MKIALVVDWPSVDATDGFLFSTWESQVIKELGQAAGFKPDLVLSAFPRWQRQPWGLFISNKPINGLIDEAQEARAKLIETLAGYDLCLTMGSYAMYALTGELKLDTYRGTHIDSPLVKNLQVVPTYSPEIFCRTAWNERPVIVSAMRKATKRYEDKPRRIHLPETVPDLYDFCTRYLKELCVFDVETCRGGRITEFSLATSSSDCLYVRLEDEAKRSLWSQQDELDIMLWLHFLSLRRDLTWVFHNATYDLSYLDAAGIRPLGHIADTMLRHHAYQPELEKSLGFLASMHVPTRAWKHLRTKSKASYNKAGAVE